VGRRRDSAGIVEIDETRKKLTRARRFERARIEHYKRKAYVVYRM